MRNSLRNSDKVSENLRRSITEQDPAIANLISS